MIDILNTMWAGLLGGVAMSIWTVAMNKSGLTTLCLGTYQGCMLTGKSSGALSAISAITMHAMFSIGIAFIYAWAITYFDIPVFWYTGLFLGLVHTLISGMILPVFDMMNSCVAKGAVRPMKLFASGHGTSGIFTFLVGHLIYGFMVVTFFHYSSKAILLSAAVGGLSHLL